MTTLIDPTPPRAPAGRISRRRLLAAGAGVLGLTGLGGAGVWQWQRQHRPDLVEPGSAAVTQAEASRRSAGARVTDAALRPAPVTVDLGGRGVGQHENASGRCPIAQVGHDPCWVVHEMQHRREDDHYGFV